MAAGMIVVGVDGSDESKGALHWALAEAALRDSKVRVVHAWWSRPALVPGAPLIAADWELLRKGAEEYVQGFVEANADPTDLDVVADAVHGAPADVLVQAAKGAELLVVGSRGHGGFAGLLLGSVSQQCVHHAPCPVVIVRGTQVATDTLTHRETDAARRVGESQTSRRGLR
jgi:nucleotide-binding universal stress UspA family protein